MGCDAVYILINGIYWETGSVSVDMTFLSQL